MYDSFVNQNKSLALGSFTEWSGATSQKFSKGKKTFPEKNLTMNRMTMPLHPIQTGRQHFVNELSPEQQFRRSKREVRWEEHWHPRKSQIRTFDFKPTSPAPRPQRKHYNQLYNPEVRFQSVKTSFFEKYSPGKEYSVEDRMQRKKRVDILELKRTFEKNSNFFRRTLYN